MNNQKVTYRDDEEQFRRWLRAVKFIADYGLAAPGGDHMMVAIDVLAMYCQEALPALAQRQTDRWSHYETLRARGRETLMPSLQTPGRGNLFAVFRDLLWDMTPGQQHPRDRAVHRLMEWTNLMERCNDAR